MLITTITTSDQLKDEFSSYDRDHYKIGTYQALIDFYDECYGDTSQELDVIAICCDLSEESYGDVISNYNIDVEYDTDEPDGDEMAEKQKEVAIEYLQEHTSVLFEGGDVISYWSF